MVGLVYDDVGSRRYCGNPPNVGLEFDGKSGDLLAIHERGVPLGLK